MWWRRGRGGQLLGYVTEGERTGTEGRGFGENHRPIEEWCQGEPENGTRTLGGVQQRQQHVKTINLIRS